MIHAVYNIRMSSPKKSEPAELVYELASRLPNGAQDLAHELGVSVVSVQRWLAGSTRPRPSLEGKIRVVAERLAVAYQPALAAWPDQVRDGNLRSALLMTCRELRECLHRRGRLSSRHEALDELSKLLFAHVMLMSDGGLGIDIDSIGNDENAASRLRIVVNEAVSRYLPVSLAHEMKAQEFQLRLRDSENELAVDIAKCFRWLKSPELVDHIRGKDSVDVLNDAFGQFIADSFIDEKELGQYLTPNEVVRFMARLGLSALSDSDRAAIVDPIHQSGAGLILDPSCGVATFLTEVLRLIFEAVKVSHGERAGIEWVDRAIRFNVVGVDKSERMLRLALTNLAMFGTKEVNLHLGNALARKNGDGARMIGFENKVKLILTNPPFGATFPTSELAGYKLASSWSRRPPKTIDSELLFLERYLDWLCAGGHLVAIVPDSVLTNRGIFEDLRRHIFANANVLAIISLPVVTFGVAGTSTKTSILHLQKRGTGNAVRPDTFFAVCRDIGYSVQTKGATRTKVKSGRNQLEDILPLALAREEGENARIVSLSADTARWDATFHAGLPSSVNVKLTQSSDSQLKVRDLAELSSERINPLRLGVDKQFDYIEISDVEGSNCSVRAKKTPCSEAPSRARKLVRTGDVVVSTVRPERRTIGVIPPELDGAVCSTGFAVLRSNRIAPLVLARLLQSDFVTAQLMRDNSGIAYPVIDEVRLMDIVLPASLTDIRGLAKVAQETLLARQETERRGREFDQVLSNVVAAWVRD